MYLFLSNISTQLFKMFDFVCNWALHDYRKIFLSDISMKNWLYEIKIYNKSSIAHLEIIHERILSLSNDFVYGLIIRRIVYKLRRRIVTHDIIAVGTCYLILKTSRNYLRHEITKKYIRVFDNGNLNTDEDLLYLINNWVFFRSENQRVEHGWFFFPIRAREDLSRSVSFPTFFFFLLFQPLNN